MESGVHAGVEVPARGHARGVLEARGRLRDDAAALHDPRELLLRLERAARPQHGPGGRASASSPTPSAPTSTTCARCSSRTDGEGLWRRFEHFKRNGNLYPTHGLGPVAHYLGVHRGDRFDPPRLDELAVARAAGLPRPRPCRRRPAAQGDLRLRRHEHEPHPDREGPHGPAAARRRLAAAVQPHQHDLGHARHLRRLPAADLLRRASPLAPPRKKGEDEDWLRVEQDRRSGRRAGSRTATRTRCGRSSTKVAEKSGHGGMDYVMSWRLVSACARGCRPTWTSTTRRRGARRRPLSEQSVARGSAPVEFPDFTRGALGRRSGPEPAEPVPTILSERIRRFADSCVSSGPPCPPREVTAATG